MAGDYLSGDKITADERKRLGAAQRGQNMDALRNFLVPEKIPGRPPR
jgi:hypothetical protein